MTENHLTVVSASLRLTSQEYKRFMEMRKSQELSSGALIKQALRVYDLYLNGGLVMAPSSAGGCMGDE